MSLFCDAIIDFNDGVWRYNRVQKIDCYVKHYVKYAFIFERFLEQLIIDTVPHICDNLLVKILFVRYDFV